jgi:hypothetical protein
MLPKGKKDRSIRAERDVFSQNCSYFTRINLFHASKRGSLSYPYASAAIKDIYGFDFAEVEFNANKIFDLIHPEDIAESCKIVKNKRN